MKKHGREELEWSKVEELENTWKRSNSEMQSWASWSESVTAFYALSGMERNQLGYVTLKQNKNITLLGDKVVTKQPRKLVNILEKNNIKKAF